MNNTYFAQNGLFDPEHHHYGQLFIAVPLTAYLVYVTEHPKEDNFLANTILQLNGLHCGLAKIAKATGLEKELVQRFLDQAKRTSRREDGREKRISNFL